MGYLGDVLVARLLVEVFLLPEVKHAASSWREAWSAQQLPQLSLDADFVGAVFVNDPAENQLRLPDGVRQGASDPHLFQLVFYNSERFGLDLENFETFESARARLEALMPNVRADDSSDGDAGGVIFQEGSELFLQLHLQYLHKEDYRRFLERATEPRLQPFEEGVPEDKEAVKAALIDRLQSLTRLAPELGGMRRKYEAMGLAEPKRIRGKPSQALVEFANFYPQYVRLVGCKGEGTAPAHEK